MLNEILEWVIEQSSPDSTLAYFRCPVCYITWWDNFEDSRHERNCWVPRLQNMVATEQSAQADGAARCHADRDGD